MFAGCLGELTIILITCSIV